MSTIGHTLYDVIRQNWSLILVVGLLVVGWFFLRTPADPVSLESFHQEIRGGQPVVVEFFSNT